MRDLAKWQLISLFSRGVAMGLGIIQSFFIIRILTVGEWGLVQIAASIGGAFGIYQHLGLASGSTREISASKNDTEIFKIFVTSVFIRYLITIPIAIYLFFAANSIAVHQYSDAALILPLKLYSIVLLIQGAQSIMNAVIAGTKRFKNLFLYQSGIAFLSLFIYIPLIYVYKTTGYFYALLLFNLVSTVFLAIVALKPLKAKFALPSKKEFKILFKELLSISLAIYLVKIIFTLWEKSGPILLGLNVSKETVGIFAFALLYARKIMTISDAITDVNLPVLSDKFVHDFDDFKKLFSKNFDKVFLFILFAASTAVFWAPQVIRIAVGGDKYDASFPFIFPMVYAFIFYSFVNIIKSSVSVPAKLTKEMVFSFISLISITVGFYFAFNEKIGHLQAMSYGMFTGAVLGFLLLVYTAQFRLKYKFFNHDHVLILIQSLAFALLSGLENLFAKFILYILLSLLFIWAIRIAHFVTDAEIKKLLNKVKI